MASVDDVAVQKDEVKFCVVCGAGSHREDWLKQTGYVACDGHSKVEIDTAVKSAEAAAAPPAKSAPAAGVKK